MIELRVLGRTDLRTPTGCCSADLIAQPRPFALLVYLTVEKPGALQRRDHLVGLFWPETDQERARSNLRKLVHTIRRALGDEVIESRGDEEIGIAPSTVRCDAVEFEDAFRSGRLARALEIYDGDLLQGFFLSGAPQFEDWLERKRAQLANTAAAASWSLALKYEENEELTNAGRFAIRTFELEAENERRLRAVMELLCRVGDRVTALRLYEKFRRGLERDYRALPARETRELFERIRDDRGC